MGSNVALLIFDLMILPITLVRLGLIYLWGSKYSIKGFTFLDVIMHSNNPYFNQDSGSNSIDTIDDDYRVVIRNDSRIYKFDILELEKAEQNAVQNTVQNTVHNTVHNTDQSIFQDTDYGVEDVAHSVEQQNTAKDIIQKKDSKSNSQKNSLFSPDTEIELDPNRDQNLDLDQSQESTETSDSTENDNSIESIDNTTQNVDNLDMQDVDAILKKAKERNMKSSNNNLTKSIFDELNSVFE